MTKEELDEIRERCNKATPGPWYFHPGDSYCAFPSIMTRNKHFLVFDIADDAPTEFPGRDEDADFVAHARDSIPSLLAYIKELESQISEHERVCSLRTLADGMNKLCPDLVEELIKRVKEYSKKEDEKFSEIMTWLKGKEDESSSS